MILKKLITKLFRKHKFYDLDGNSVALKSGCYSIDAVHKKDGSQYYEVKRIE